MYFIVYSNPYCRLMLKVTHQSFAVEQSCPAVASCGPFGEANDVV